ncbi:MAG: hypothetical protein WBA51_17010 [Erythrobacter sp.]
MKRTTQLLGAVSAAALVVMSSTPAIAAGIRAGTDITNTVEVTYDSGGVTQTPVTATDVFAVDRRVNVTVASVATNVGVTAGEQDAVVSFDVTNLSNDTVDLDLSAALGTGSAAGSGANFTFHIDANNNGQIDAGEAAVTFLDEVAADATVRVLVATDIGTGVNNGDTIDVVLTANAFIAGNVGTLGDVGGVNELTESAGDSTDQSVVDTVLADGSGVTDAANQGDFSASATYTVAGAQVTVLKSSLVVSDPINNDTSGAGGVDPDAKAIPGAVIRYCIAVSNAAGGADATDIAISDTLPGDVVFNAGTILRNTDVSISGTDATCDVSTGAAPANATEGSESGGTVSGTLDTVTAGDSLGFAFEVTIPAATAATPPL